MSLINNPAFSKTLKLLQLMKKGIFYRNMYSLGSITSHYRNNSLISNRHLNCNIYHHYQYTRTVYTSPIAMSSADEMIDITFITPDGKKLKTKGKIGDNLLDVVVNNQVDLDGFGACEGTLACSTCHLVFKKPDFDKITDKITDEELDMLDLAYGLQDTSRLGCQVTLKKELDGLEVEVPAGVNDQRG